MIRTQLVKLVNEMNDALPAIRRDLEFIPVEYQGRQLILVRDQLGLVPEGKAIEFSLYRLMAMLSGKTTVRDIQMTLMRERGGVLVGSEEVKGLVAHLDESYLLDSDRFREARDRIVKEFSACGVRSCSHAGKAYPDNPRELREKLDAVMAGSPSSPIPDRKPLALVSPHIDLSVGSRGYASAYRCLKNSSPARVVVLGVGHQGFQGLFALTEKAFSTPLGNVKTEETEKLRDAGKEVVAPDDFAHKEEHSIEFQVIFLQHVLNKRPFSLIPILCGFLPASLSEYGRQAYLDKAGTFLEALKEMVRNPSEETLVVAGVDFSHIGPKFGHDMPARQLESRSQAHDKSLLHCLASMDAEGFWEESIKVKDQYNVCGFAALACLLEVLPPCKGDLLHYEIWHEEATRSAVSFAAVVFEETMVSRKQLAVSSK
jgi:AmmeMemoRadiSam system protein B